MCQKKKEHTHLGVKTQRGQGQRLGHDGNKKEKKRRQKKYEMTKLCGIECRKGPTGHRINRVN
jgi:hypothetical protein